MLLLHTQWMATSAIHSKVQAWGHAVPKSECRHFRKIMTPHVTLIAMVTLLTF